MGVKWAVEIETHVPPGVTPRGSHGCGVQVPWLPAGWKADADPSIRALPGRVGVEFVSPVFEGAAGVAALKAAVAEIKARGGRVNDSCGVHVHVDFDKRDRRAVAKLTRLVANHEKGLFAATGTKKRERGVGSRYGTCWCKPIKPYGSASAAIRVCSRDRYHGLNLCSAWPTVEFRFFSGSLNAVKLLAWVRLCVGLVERSAVADKPIPWNHRGRPAGLNGVGVNPGAKEVARLVFALGWTYEGFGTRRHGRRVFGALEGEDRQALDQDVKALLGLAEKYDQEQ